MVLFKPFSGPRASLDAQELHEGYVYFCIDDGSFHIDFTDADGNLQRKQINAKDAEMLTGMTLEEIQKSISWNDLTDKPFYEETHEPIVWDRNLNDENIEEYELARGVGGSVAPIWVKVSDEVFTKEQVVGGYLSVSGMDEGEIPEEIVIQYEGTMSILDGMIFSTASTGFIDTLAAHVPSAGTYFAYMEGVAITLIFPEQVKKIDEKYIPDTIARVADVEVKVDKVEGKDLSTNDYTDDDKAKVDSAVQTASTGVGLKVTKTDTDIAIDFDEEVIFVFDSGTSDSTLAILDVSILA